MMRTIIRESLKKSVSYLAYRKQVSDLLVEGMSTGENQSDALLNYSMLNDRRMRRLDKKTVLLDKTIGALKNRKKNRTWLLITEGWCGDAAPARMVWLVSGSDVGCSKRSGRRRPSGRRRERRFVRPRGSGAASPPADAAGPSPCVAGR